MIFAISGGRDYRISKKGFSILDKVNEKYAISLLLSGHCPTDFNVDKDGEAWAEANNVEVKLFPAAWKLYGRAAGPRRNAEMAEFLNLNKGIFLVFKGGSGTQGMRQECDDRLVPVINLTHDKYVTETPLSLD